MRRREGRSRGAQSTVHVLAFIVLAAVAAGCGGRATVVPATATLDPPAADGSSGWYRSGPVMSLAGVGQAGAAFGLQYSLDGGGSWMNYSDPVTLPETDAGTVTYRTTDIWGLPTDVRQLTYAADRTSPVVSYYGNVGWYWPSQFISIGCSASDSLSGLASNNCQWIQGYGSGFGYGTHTRSATATDNAGNTGTGTVSFSVYDTIIFLPLDPVILLPNQ
jgi:hypothetical protein